MNAILGRLPKTARLLSILLGISLVCSIHDTKFPQLHAQEYQYHWSDPQNISNTPHGSWFPDLAVDSKGNVHIVWCETSPARSGIGLDETVFYRVMTEDGWSTATDLVPPNADIVRNALAVDQYENIYLAYRYSGGGALKSFVKWSRSDEAWSANSWSTGHRVDHRGDSYGVDIEIDSKGVIHLVFDDRGGADSASCPDNCADIYYRSSDNQGRNWTQSINLSNSLGDGTRGQIEIDGQDVIHVTWDEGSDQVSSSREPEKGCYSFSADSGKSWSPIETVTYPDSTVAQLTAGSNGLGGVMLVWRARSNDAIYHQWSENGGESWERPGEIPGIWARPWSTPFDIFDMTTDSAGQIHLLVVGREAPETDVDLGIYHLVWNGESWSEPAKVFSVPNLFPEYPKIVVQGGNQLHATWFTREGDIFDTWASREVWYSRSESSAPRVEVTPVSTPTPRPPTLTPPARATATLFPTISAQDSGLPKGLYSETDDIGRLLIALLPVVVLTAGIFLVTRRGWLRVFRP